MSSYTGKQITLTASVVIANPSFTLTATSSDSANLFSCADTKLNNLTLSLTSSADHTTLGDTSIVLTQVSLATTGNISGVVDFISTNSAGTYNGNYLYGTAQLTDIFESTTTVNTSAVTTITNTPTLWMGSGSRTFSIAISDTEIGTGTTHPASCGTLSAKYISNISQTIGTTPAALSACVIANPETYFIANKFTLTGQVGSDSVGSKTYTCATSFLTVLPRFNIRYS